MDDIASPPIAPVRAAGVIARSPQGRVLLCNRTDGEGWAWPGGGLKPGETPEQCAWREFFEETGYRLGGVGQPLMRRIKDGCDFTTFICNVEDEFVPRLNHEHSAYGWFDGATLLCEAEEGGGAEGDDQDEGAALAILDGLEARLDAAERRSWT